MSVRRRPTWWRLRSDPATDVAADTAVVEAATAQLPGRISRDQLADTIGWPLARLLAGLAALEDRLERAGTRLDADEGYSVAREHGEPDVVVLAFGVLGDQARAEHDAEHATAVLHTDYVAQVAALTHVANRLRTAGRGEIVVFSSIAGVRVRRANYVYGSAKAGLDGFASGLADALHGSGVHLVLVRPGFVVGRMTAGSGLTPVTSLSPTPEQVADATARALARGRSAVVWVPATLRLVAAVMRALPRPVWRRMPR